MHQQYVKTITQSTNYMFTASICQ